MRNVAIQILMMVMIGIASVTTIFADEQTDYDEAVRLSHLDDTESHLAAQAKFERFLADYPNSDKVPGALFMLGKLESNPNRAMSIYQKIVDRYPNSEYADDALFEVAQYHYSVGQYLTAIDQHRRVLETSKDINLLCRSQYWLASAEYATQQYTAALTDYQHVIDQYPNCEKTSWAMLGVARTQMRFGKFDQAELTYRQILQQYTDRGVLAAAFYGIGENAELGGRYDFALQSYERVLTDFPTSHEAALAREKVTQLKKTITVPPQSTPPPVTPHPAPVAPPPPATPDSTVPEKTIFTIQVGAFTDRLNAEKQMNHIREIGYSAEVIDRTAENSQTPFLVWVGQFETREEAKHVARRLLEDIPDISTFIRARSN
ncbi:MAG: hypothetical protein D6675_15055 [Gemmatimonadetes bacterium]|nr:MAG: hypothetical protein D6675_15055 [Gemmatimonadota bacterium]